MDIIKNFGESGEHALKNRLVLFLALFTALTAVVGVYFVVITGKALKGNELPKPQISVSGEGKIFVRPDIALFTATVVTSAVRVGDAQGQNSSGLNKIVDFLKKQGIQEKDIKTVNYSLQPQYEYSSGRPCPVILGGIYPCPVNTPPRIVSYEVRSSLEIKVRDLNKVDDLLQGVVTSGANEVGSISFTVEDEKAAMAEARKEAIDDAQAKAEVLARDLGVRLKKIIGFSEFSEGPIFYAKAYEVSGVGGASAPAPQVQPGEQEIRSNVTITYEFR
ncbi:MAG: SIMPL domain-containing protein [bacterium]|nr:SIMPL domain-containing protein [bacterium]